MAEGAASFTQRGPRLGSTDEENEKEENEKIEENWVLMENAICDTLPSFSHPQRKTTPSVAAL
jgi:hypothetical protein